MSIDKNRDKNPQWIRRIEDIQATNLSLIGNEMSDNLFFTLAHTPIDMNGSRIEKNGRKIIVCMSEHDFIIKKNKLEYQLDKSGLLVRDDADGIQNTENILYNNPASVVLVSQIAKKYFDKQIQLEQYKSRIFCILQGKSGITNKLSTPWKKIKKVKVHYTSRR